LPANVQCCTGGNASPSSSSNNGSPSNFGPSASSSSGLSSFWSRFFGGGASSGSNGNSGSFSGSGSAGLLRDEPSLTGTSAKKASGPSGGFIALIVIVIVVLITGVAVCALLIIRQRSLSRAGPDAMIVANESYAPPQQQPEMAQDYSQAYAGVGHYACQQCAQTYAYADDLATHVKLRHT